MAGERAFPWSGWLEKINHKLHIPLNFIFVIVGVEVVIGLISLGSDYAYNVIISGAGVCFTVAYALPVAVVSIASEKMAFLHADESFRLSLEVGQSFHLVPISILVDGDI